MRVDRLTPPFVDPPLNGLNIFRRRGAARSAASRDEKPESCSASLSACPDCELKIGRFRRLKLRCDSVFLSSHFYNLLSRCNPPPTSRSRKSSKGYTANVIN